MNHVTTLLILLLGGTLGGCGAGGGGGAPSPAAGSTDFTQFVKDQFDTTDNISDPVEINALTFGGVEIETEGAYADVLAREADENRKPDGNADR